ncbi:MAG: hypothetical protein ACEQSO_06640, partial [Aquirufa sp.]
FEAVRDIFMTALPRLVFTSKLTIFFEILKFIQSLPFSLTIEQIQAGMICISLLNLTQKSSTAVQSKTIFGK